MSHLNIYLSKEREKWLRQELEELARDQRRSLSFIVEEALVQFLKQEGKQIPDEERKDHRSRFTR